MPPLLSQSTHAEPLPHGNRVAMAQVGWLGFSGAVYPLDDKPLSGGREPAGVSPLYIPIGIWENLGDGKFGIKD